MRTSLIRKTPARACLLLLLLFIFFIPTKAATRSTDVSTASDGCQIILVPGSFEKTDTAAILKKVNDYRKEACEKGYPDPRNPSRKLISSDYVPVKWAGDLEWIAQTRAAEGSVLQDHTRPNGDLCFNCTHNGVFSDGECLAWNNSGVIRGIEQWYAEKEDWINQRAGVTGHYTAMIDPSVLRIGMGCFTSKSGGWSCIAGEFSGDDSLSATSQGVSGSCFQKMEVASSQIGKAGMEGKASIAIGSSSSYKVTQYISFPGIMGGILKTPIQTTINSWSVSSPSKASITQGGKLTGKKEGRITVKATLSDGTVLSKEVNITAPVKGTRFKVKSGSYKITTVKKEVTFIGKDGAKGSLTVPNTVKYLGRTYKVTSIEKNAMKNNKKITSLIIGKNIKKIGKRAFYKCSKVKSLTLKTKRLKSSTVGAGAFTGTNIRKVKCPSGKRKAYKKILLKKGVKKM